MIGRLALFIVGLFFGACLGLWLLLDPMLSTQPAVHVIVRGILV